MNCTYRGEIQATTNFTEGTTPKARGECPTCGRELTMMTKREKFKALPHRRPELTGEQRESLAFAVMSQVADLVEFWEEKADYSDLGDVDPMAALAQIVKWMEPISRDGGGVWNTQFPQPDA